MVPAMLHELPFSVWDPVVRDLMDWHELAGRHGCQDAFEAFVTSDPDGGTLDLLYKIAENGHAYHGPPIRARV